MIFDYEGIVDNWLASWIRYYDGIVDTHEMYIYIPSENAETFKMFVMLTGV